MLMLVATPERVIEEQSGGAELNSGAKQNLEDEHQWQCPNCQGGDMVVVEGGQWTQEEREAWAWKIENGGFQERKFGQQPDFHIGISKRKSIMPEKLEFRPWPDAIVKYCFHRDINELAREALEDGMAEWAARTCIRFQENSNNGDCPARQTVVFQSHEKGCWAHAGYYTDVELKLNLGGGCRSKGIAMHELGHTIGFHHEHQRHDRDEYVVIQWQNIDPDYVFAFKTKEQSLTGGYKYDLASIMHYSEKAFSTTGAPTILMKNSGQGETDSWGNCEFGNRFHLSRGDILSTNAGYGCDKRAGAEFCIDLSKRCEQFKDNCPVEGQDSEQFLIEFGEMFQTNVDMQLKMRVMCRMTCGLCECKDNEGDEGWCQHRVNSLSSAGCEQRYPDGTLNEHFPDMVRKCRRTCGFCAVQGATQCETNAGEVVSVLSMREFGKMLRYRCPDIPLLENGNFLCSSLVKRTCPLQCGLCAAEPYCRAAHEQLATSVYKRTGPRSADGLNNTSP